MSETHPSDERPARAFSFASLLKYTAGIFGVVVTAFLIYIIYQTAVSKNKYTIETFSVTKRLTENGFTGAIATQRILDAIAKFYDESSTRVKREDLELKPDTTGLAIPESGISVDIIASTIRQLLPRGWVHQISGEFTSSNGATNLRIRRNGEVIYSQTETGPNSVDKLIEEGAFRIIEGTQPYVAASFLYNEHKTAQAEIILDNIIDTESDDQKDGLSYVYILKGITYAYVLKGIIAEDQADDSAAEIYFKKAIASNPSLAISYADLSELQLKQGKVDDADQTMRDAISRNANDQYLHLYYALNLQSLGRLDDAIREYGTAISLDQTNGDPHAAFGTLWHAQGRLEDAIREYRAAIHLDPKSAYPHVNLGSIWYTKQKFDDAIAEFRQAVQLDPKSADAHSGVGAVLQARDKPDDAVAEYHEALRLDPKSADAHVGLGAVLQAQNKLDEAAAEYRAAIQSDPKSAASYDGLGAVLQAQGKLDDAAAQYREAIRLDQKSGGPHGHLGMVLAMQNKLDDAAAQYREAIRLDSKDFVSHINLGNLLNSQDKLDDAVVEYREAIRLDATNSDTPRAFFFIPQTASEARASEAVLRGRRFSEIHDNLANIFRVQDKNDDAVAEYREAIRLAPSNATPHLDLGSLLYEEATIAAEAEFPAAVQSRKRALATPDPTLHTLGKLDDAAAEYGEAILLEPKSAFQHANLASVLLELGRLDDAAAEYREAIRLDPKPFFYTWYTGLGAILLSQGNFDGAAAEYREAIRMAPEYPLLHRLLAQVLNYASVEGEETHRIALRKESCSELQEAAKLWRFNSFPESVDILDDGLRSAARCEFLSGVKRAGQEKAVALP